MSQLQNFVGQDITKALRKMIVRNGTSKDGNAYEFIELEFINGFTTRIYANSQNEFGYLNAIQTMLSGTSEGQGIVNSGTPVSNTGVPF